MMFNTYTMSQNAKFSPGLILMRDVIDHFADQNYRAFDFGVGSYDYKLLFCKDREPIFDSLIALSVRGRFAVGAMSAVNEAKRLVKSNPALSVLICEQEEAHDIGVGRASLGLRTGELLFETPFTLTPRIVARSFEGLVKRLWASLKEDREVSESRRHPEDGPSLSRTSIGYPDI